MGFAAGDPNLSRYVGNNAANATDPSGLEPDGLGALLRPTGAPAYQGSDDGEVRGLTFALREPLMQGNRTYQRTYQQAFQRELKSRGNTWDAMRTAAAEAEAAFHKETNNALLTEGQLFWDNVKKLDPEVAEWWVKEMNGTVVRRNANWNPFTGALFNFKSTGTCKEGGSTSVMYLHDAWNEIEAAQHFIKEVKTGDFSAYWHSRHLNNPEDFPKAGQDRKEWFIKEAARTGATGASIVGAWYTIHLEGVVWVVMADDVLEGKLRLDPNYLFALAKILPLARGSTIRAVNKAGEAIGEYKAGDQARRVLLTSAAEGGRVGPAFDAAKLDRIVANLEKQGVTVLRDETAVRYLNSRAAGAAYIPEMGKPGILFLRPDARRLEVLEELYHHGQHVRAGYKLPTEATALIQAQREVEAQNALLRMAREGKWTQEEIDLLVKNQRYWEQQLRLATGK